MLRATASRLPSDCSAAQSSGRGCIPHTKRPARRAQPVLASAGQQASGRGPEGPFRKVLFIQFNDSSERLENVTQKSLDELREKHKAEGFAAPDGCCTQDLADLPERANVRVMYKQDVYKTIRQMKTQLVNLQQADSSKTLSKEQLLGRYLKSFAVAEHPGAPIVDVKTSPFKKKNGQDFVQFDAACIVGGTLYVGEHKRKLGTLSVADAVRKLSAIRDRAASPELALALQGITGIKLFLSGEGVAAGLPPLLPE
ncbi:hypothetical protein ABPG77_007890 [Micractinium sp. CCAP 211/92]